MIKFREKKEILDDLDRYKEQIVSGEITGIMIACETSDGGSKIIYGTGCEDSRRFAGTLLEMLIERLSFKTS